MEGPSVVIVLDWDFMPRLNGPRLNREGFWVRSAHEVLTRGVEWGVLVVHFVGVLEWWRVSRLWVGLCCEVSSG